MGQGPSNKEPALLSSSSGKSRNGQIETDSDNDIRDETSLDGRDSFG